MRTAPYCGPRFVAARAPLVACILVAGWLVAARDVAAKSSTPVAVSSCGQIVDGDGFLTGNIDCTGHDATPFALLVSPGGSLDLRGFTVDAAGVQDGVDCGTWGPDAGGQVVLIVKGSCTISNGTIRGAAAGVTVERLRATDLQIRDNGERGIFGVGSARVELHGAVVSGNPEIGILARSLRAFSTTIVDNGNGILSRSASLRDSNVTGNGGSPECRGPCVDVVTSHKPRLRNSMCDHSFGRLKPPYDWDVCRLD